MIKVIHDGEIEISSQPKFSDPITAVHTTWSKFVNQISKSVKTDETHQQYIRMSKDHQGVIKHVGGFVGGIFSGTTRNKNSLINRSLLTLDVDNGTLNQFEDFSLIYGCAAVLYSTHSHSPDTPSFRIIIPLLRPVDGDEFEAVSRMVVKTLEPKQFCSTSFVRHQIMFWPSHSCDIEPVFEFQDGEWLDPDEVLKEYGDWKDIREWKLGDVKIGAKQEDPLTKTGPVGVFCRCYTVHEAIDKFIPDYRRSDFDPGVYTYVKGTTSNGVKTYDDKYVYSHHSSDPISERLCNAFDLVRLHLYGDEDLHAKEKTAGNKMPSYKKMIDLMDADRKCKIAYLRENQDQITREFSEKYVDESGEVASELDWAGDLETLHGLILPTRQNIVLVLTHDKLLKENFRYDDFAKRAMVKSLPWREVTQFNNELLSSDLAALRHYIEFNYKIDNVNKVKDALDIVMQQNKFHPIKEYFEPLKWDGEARLETIFIDYLGASDNEYVRTVTRKHLVAAVARIYQPGIKFDTMLVFLGNQGKGKSWIVGKLGMNWFSDTLGSLHSKEAMENLQGIWLLEIPELSQFKRSDIETVKAFVSKREDRFRVPYSEMSSNFARQCVFFGTTNEADFLQDQTGNRRFWPIDISHAKGKKNVFTEFTQKIVDQVWAEAIDYYICGEELYLDEQMEFEAKTVQENHTVQNPQEEFIKDYLDELLPTGWDDMELPERRMWLAHIDPIQDKGVKKRNIVCVQEIWCEVLGEPRGKMNANNTRFINAFMRLQDGWIRSKERRKVPGYGVMRVYIRQEKLSDRMEIDDLL